MTIRTIGSQKRERIEDTNYRIVKTWPDVDRGSVVLEDADGKRELWFKNNRAACYVVEIDGVGYEFARSL